MGIFRCWDLVNIDDQKQPGGFAVWRCAGRDSDAHKNSYRTVWHIMGLVVQEGNARDSRGAPVLGSR
jgi:hypothetical protein